jgi:hypothetical protein
MDSNDSTNHNTNINRNIHNILTLNTNPNINNTVGNDSYVSSNTTYNMRNIDSNNTNINTIVNSDTNETGTPNTNNNNTNINMIANGTSTLEKNVKEQKFPEMSYLTQDTAQSYNTTPSSAQQRHAQGYKSTNVQRQKSTVKNLSANVDKLIEQQVSFNLLSVEGEIIKLQQKTPLPMQAIHYCNNIFMLMEQLQANQTN